MKKIDREQRYNKQQLENIVRYAKQNNVALLTLHAYVAISSIMDDDSYTKAHNADVSEMVVAPDDLIEGVETLIDQHGTDVTISSKVRVDGELEPRHIPMLDFILPAAAKHKATPELAGLLWDVDNFLHRTTGQSAFGPPTFYVSGTSYHGYGISTDPFPDSQFRNVIGAILVCDHNRIADHAWLGFSLARGEFRLRVTAVQSKYKMLPTLPRDAYKNQYDGVIVVVPETTPF